MSTKRIIQILAFGRKGKAIYGEMTSPTQVMLN